MIKIINGSERHLFAREADEMFKGRALVFRDRLGWEVNVRDGWEIDAYDDENPLYIVSVDALTGRVRGSLRLLPTTGRHMMRDIFISYFDAPVLIESATIWECTRFCVHPYGDAAELTATGVSRTAVELLLGICEVGLEAGLTQITGVFERPMTRIYRRAGWSPEVIARSDRASCGTICAGLWDVDEASLASLRACAGIDYSVLEGPAPVRAVA